MKFNFVENCLLAFNGFLLVFQLMLMGSIPSLFNFSILNLFIPVVVLVNLFLFCYWLMKMKWPFLLFMGAFLIGYGEWSLLYQFPNNTVRKSSSTFSVMSYNVRLFNKYRWIDSSTIATSIEDLILEKDPAEILRNYSKMPQINISVNVKNKDILSDSKIQQKIKEIESDLTVGRVLVRASGTESKIRVTVESDDATTASKYAKDIAEMFAS